MTGNLTWKKSSFAPAHGIDIHIYPMKKIMILTRRSLSQVSHAMSSKYFAKYYDVSDSRLNCYSLDYFLKIHEFYENVLNNMNAKWDWISKLLKNAENFSL